MLQKSEMKSKCHRVRIRKESVGLILISGRYERRGVCPECMSFCEIYSSSKIFSAALQLLKNIYKGIIITIAICFLLPFFLIVLISTHVLCISDKIKLIPISRIRDDLSIM